MQHKTKKPVKAYDRKNKDAVRRDTKQGFVIYMSQNEGYFQDIFGQPATAENVCRAAVIFCGEGGQ